MTISASLSKLLTKKPQGKKKKKKKNTADQRLKYFSDQVLFAPSYFLGISPVLFFVVVVVVVYLISMLGSSCGD